jgi:DNA repair exonuclease SbcCD ATPase subunit
VTVTQRPPTTVRDASPDVADVVICGSAVALYLTLWNRSDELDARHTAIKQLQAEVTRTQRETLEMRLATEELWGQMSGSVPPATVTQSLARLRAKLAEHYRLQAADIAAQRKDLEDLAAKVTLQHQQVAAQKRELDVWTTHQQSEIESQAARLVAREEELDREQDRTRQQRTQWDSNRRKMEAEIRRLQNEARRAQAECVGTE